MTAAALELFDGSCILQDKQGVELVQAWLMKVAKLSYDVKIWCLQECKDCAYSAKVSFSCVRAMLTALASLPLQNCCCHQEWPTPTAFTRSNCLT